MILSYGTLLSRKPLSLSIGKVRKPTISDIEDVGFESFYLYESFLKMTPNDFYTDLDQEGAEIFWNHLSEKEKEECTMYDAICRNPKLQTIYCELFTFFFEIECVKFVDNVFFLLKKDIDLTDSENKEVAENISGIIFKDTFDSVLFILQQVCAINDDMETPIEEMKFKNKMAKEMYLKMREAERKNKKSKAANPDLQLENIISAVSNRHPSINPLNVHDLTIYQLLDSFNRLMANAIYEIDSTRVSVWGDEKKTFNASLWYKNHFK